jgi:mRNA-degrading endonuclease RelE of RelBE toxin-antitoxin system
MKGPWPASWPPKPKREKASGLGDVKALKGALKGRYRLRVGKWRIFFSLDQPGNVVVTDVDNRGQAY